MATLLDRGPPKELMLPTGARFKPRVEAPRLAAKTDKDNASPRHECRR
jgi:hypothetical protein